VPGFTLISPGFNTEYISFVPEAHLGTFGKK
jgi:hypothetical protein